jgi:glycosyltransferase involved in cell wall biosynthesis
MTADVDATIVGGHPAEPDLSRVRALVDSLSLGRRVTLTGLVPPAEVAGLLRSAHVLVLPNSASAISAAYTSPLKLFEYLAAGRPIVASDLPAFREVIGDEQAVLVAPDDPGALAAALTALRDDYARRVRMGEAAFALASAYTWDARAAHIETLCREVVGA